MRKVQRRCALKAIGGTLLFASGGPAAEETKQSGLGLVVYCTRLRRDALRRKDPGRDLYSPATFLDHCINIGAGGMQVPLGIMTPQQTARLRESAEQAGKYIEAIVRAPFEPKDADRFDAELKTAKAAGALAVRTTIIPGRRYEFFDSLEKFREFDARGRRAVERAAPLCEKHRIPLAVENHKDHRDSQRLALFEHISSEFVGACVDTGNSFALLEDPIETVQRFAPWAHSVHLKDQALARYDDGFLLGDIPLGRGGLDLNAMVAILKKAKPTIRFSLELITRDPLKVPCLTKKYWATFPDVPGRELARTLRYVRDHESHNQQYISKMTPAEQLAREDANVAQSLAYAREVLRV